MTILSWALANEKFVGLNHPTFGDVVNRPLRQMLSLSGRDPDAAFTGLRPVFNVKSYGAPWDGVNDDAPFVNAAASAAFAAGGGDVVFPAGTGITGASLILYPKVHYVGAGREATIIKAKPGTAVDVFKGNNYDSLTGTNSADGAYAWAIRHLTIDGNSGAGATGVGVKVYGYSFDVQNVAIRFCSGDGWLSEWGTATTPSPNRSDFMESVVIGLRSHDNGGWGIHWKGPHDSYLAFCVAALNGNGIWNDGAGDAVFMHGCHVWGSNTIVGFQLDHITHCTECYAEPAGTNAIGFAINAQQCQLEACRASSSSIGYEMQAGGNHCRVKGVSSGNGTGLKITNPASANDVDLMIQSPTVSPITFNGTDAGGHVITAHVDGFTGSVISGTPSGATTLKLYTSGGTTGGQEKGSIMAPTAWARVDLADGASVAIDASKGNWFRFAPSTTGAKTIQFPTNLVQGQPFIFECFNNSGGTITLTFAAGWHVGWTDPAGGKVRALLAVAENNPPTVLIQIGAVSPDT